MDIEYYRDYVITPRVLMGDYIAEHKDFKVTRFDNGEVSLSHPVIDGVSISECKFMINEWYEEIENDKSNKFKALDV